MTGRQQVAIGLLVLGVASAIAFGATRYLRKELFPVAVGSVAPDFTAVTLDSIPREKHLAEYRGQVIMINVWATWCAPCRVEMPSIEALHRAYAAKGFKVLAVSIDDPGHAETIRAFVDQYNLTFEVLHEGSGAIEHDYQTSGIPETFVIGRDGVIRKRVIGAAAWNSAANINLVRGLLAEAP